VGGGRAAFAALLDKQVDYVLAAHGGPFDRTALEQALTQPSE